MENPKNFTQKKKTLLWMRSHLNRRERHTLESTPADCEISAMEARNIFPSSVGWGPGRGECWWLSWLNTQWELQCVEKYIFESTNQRLVD